MTASDRIHIDDARWHPTLVFVQDRETRDTLAVDRATGAIVGSHRSDYRRAINAELISVAIELRPAKDPAECDARRCDFDLLGRCWEHGTRIVGVRA